MCIDGIVVDVVEEVVDGGRVEVEEVVDEVVDVVAGTVDGVVVVVETGNVEDATDDGGADVGDGWKSETVHSRVPPVWKSPVHSRVAVPSLVWATA
jgi:hypothetical protein